MYMEILKFPSRYIYIFNLKYRFQALVLELATLNILIGWVDGVLSCSYALSTSEALDLFHELQFLIQWNDATYFLHVLKCHKLL